MKTFSKLLALIILSLIPIQGMQADPDLAVDRSHNEIAALRSMIKTIVALGAAGYVCSYTKPDAVMKWCLDFDAEYTAAKHDYDLVNFWLLKKMNRVRFWMDKKGLNSPEDRQAYEILYGLIKVGSGVVPFYGAKMLLWLLV